MAGSMRDRIGWLETVGDQKDWYIGQKMSVVLEERQIDFRRFTSTTECILNCPAAT